MGKVLGGRYETLKQLAAGGMATVHLGRALGVGGFERLVAIKLMHQHIAAEPEFVSMFLDEARLAARIRHPNVVPTLDVQESPDGLFLVMEYIEGASLHQILKAAGGLPGSMPLPIVLRVMIDTLAGLHCAHELTDDEGHPLALVHRDVSPVNILLGVDGVARLTDFGVARAESRLSSTRGGQLKGKIPYMPPEQIMSEEIDRRCDVYAAGAVFWEALIGRRLFQADNDGAILQGILAGPPATPRQVDPSIPESIDRICMRALARKRAERFSTAAEFSEAIEHAAQQAGVAIASARVVASFVEGSGAYKKVSPKELAALKQGVAGAPAAPPSGPSRPSMPSTPLSSKAAAPAPVLLEQPTSSPTAPSQVTSAGAALSAPTSEQGRAPRRLGTVLGAAALVVAIGGVAVFATRPWGGGGEPSSKGPAANVQTAAPAAAPTAAAPAEPVMTASSSASAVPVASSSSAPAASSAPVKSTPTRPGGSPPPAAKDKPPAGPKPGATAYDPDRL